MLWERLSLAEDRIRELSSEWTAEDPGTSSGTTETVVLSREWNDYMAAQGKLFCLLCDIRKEVKEGIEKVPIERLKQWNQHLYEDILPEQYEKSYANPAYASACFGSGMGKLLSTYAAEFRSAIPYVFERNMRELVIRMELLLELYSCVMTAFSEDGRMPSVDAVREILYWYVSDYSDVESEQRVAEMVDEKLDFALRIILQADLDDPEYLYRYGEYITDNELRLASYMSGLSQETVDLIADTFTEGYRMGFVNTGKDLNRKKTVNIRYPLGFERVVRQAVYQFQLMGLKPVIYRAGSSVFRRQGTNKIGYFGANPNKQYDYDHKEDEALFLDGQFVTRKLECLQAAFEEYKEQAYGHAGPAVMEGFGEKPFVPVVKPEANALSEAQQKLLVKYQSQSAKITNQYIKGEERSFTIIAFPVPEIGEQFEEIFDETIRINTLDYQTYRNIQQTMIDTLDQAKEVHVKGCGKNRTDITVALADLKDAAHETKFENCVADVNIPVGEVFTSPRLQGTNGVLHVSRVYLNELEYHDLELTFKDGMVTEYSCKNFENRAENEKYIRDNVLFHHDTLPLGEFAIGTNTTAYMAARKYDIAGKLPILIAEKTGPHFAVGDTCYSHSEDIQVFNPDGKEIIARDNEISILRKEDDSKAYFHCHTDITIPYDELGVLEAVKEDGSRVKIIENGRFVLPGCETLNEALA
ncbi:MAG: aminopeptidase [Lachnospiraceae bacterium]|nr:aminopeptidase [Lachnospiraceae bacterium]